MARTTIARWQPFADLADGEHGTYVPEVVEVEDDLLTISEGGVGGLP